MPDIGDIAPDFELPNQDGKSVRLSDFRGKKVILFAFPMANSSGCTMQACGFRDALPTFEGINAVILGISADSQSQLRKFKTGQKLPYDLLSDTEHKVLNEWNSWGFKWLSLIRLPLATRSVWVIDEKGRILDMKINVGVQESIDLALNAVKNAPAPAKAVSGVVLH